MRHWLVMQGSDGSTRQFHVGKPRIVIGREPTCDVRVPLSSVAQKHCQITRDEAGALRIKNLGMANGTSRNGQPILTRVLTSVEFNTDIPESLFSRPAQ